LSVDEQRRLDRFHPRIQRLNSSRRPANRVPPGSRRWRRQRHDTLAGGTRPRPISPIWHSRVVAKSFLFLVQVIWLTSVLAMSHWSARSSRSMRASRSLAMKSQNHSAFRRSHRRSMGLRSGEYGGRKTGSKRPHRSVGRRPPSPHFRPHGFQRPFSAQIPRYAKTCYDLPRTGVR